VVELKLSRADRVYFADEPITGKIFVINRQGEIQHSGIRLHLLGSVQMRLNEKAVGMFEAMLSNIQPISLVNQYCDIAPPGRLPEGRSEIPFSVPVAPNPDGPGVLYETYHGVNINVQYGVSGEVLRPAMRGGALATGLMEFVIEDATTSRADPKPYQFALNRASQNVISNDKNRLANFQVEGRVDTTICPITMPVTGVIQVLNSEHKIASIDLQLVRKEEITVGGKTASDISEVQSIQLADGDICHQMEIPVYMILPRLYTCPSLNTPQFAIDFEMNLVVAFQQGHNPTDKNALMAAYKFPVKIIRG